MVTDPPGVRWPLASCMVLPELQELAAVITYIQPPEPLEALKDHLSPRDLPEWRDRTVGCSHRSGPKNSPPIFVQDVQD